jgi:hypothetical protein
MVAIPYSAYEIDNPENEVILNYSWSMQSYSSKETLKHGCYGRKTKLITFDLVFE